MTKVRVTTTDRNTPFNTEQVFDLETLIQLRDNAYQAYSDMLDDYGDADEDVQFAEQEYIALDRLIDNAEVV